MYIKKLSKNLLYFLFALLAIELASYSTLYFYYNIIKNSENEHMVKYLRNFHPLVRENAELRAYEYVHEYAQILGYKLRPNFSYEKQGRTRILETDNYGFIHNGQKSKIHEVLNSNIEEKYLKIIFLGGST